jgi:serine/threonine protein kinase/tetratricopeptide (TPR) repeat protein
MAPGSYPDLQTRLQAALGSGYDVEKELGGGGMSRVFLAEETRLGRKVVVKVLPPEMAAGVNADRFEREIQLAARLQHPHIVPLLTAGAAGDLLFYIMPYIEGESLRAKLAREHELPVGEAIRILKEVLDALHYAHSHRVVHRDIKPDNVLITGRHAVVTDFGVAKAVSESSEDETLTSPGVALGTPAYMAPEQAAAEAYIDHRADIYAVGALAYELLTGRPPFTGHNAQAVLAAHLTQCPEPVTAHRSAVPTALNALILRCLEKKPADRWQRADDLIPDLDAMLTPTGTQPARPVDMPRDRASIAVLPFDNLTGDPSQDYFADGIVEEIITGLSRIKWLFVISRNSSFIYKGKLVDVTTVGRELGVRYVLRGSVRRSGDQVRLSGQLAETGTAGHVWADRYDGTLGDIFTLQDQMTMSVIGAVEPTLRKAEVERARRKRPDNLDAYDLFLRALPLATTAMPEDAESALGLLEEAIRLEPDYAAVHGFIAWCHEQRYLRAGLQAETREAALRHAHAAIEAGSDDAMALSMGGFVIGVLTRNYGIALDAIDRSLALSPSSALAFGFSSIIRVLKGEDHTAVEHARMGIRLGPYDPLIYLPYVGLAYAHFFAGNFVEAASAAGRASAANPRFSVPRYLHTAALVGLGQLQEAKSMAKVLLGLQPGFTISGLVSGNITTRERMAMLADALRVAGLPE